MNLSLFFSVCFVVAFLYIAKTAIERKEEKKNERKKSESHKRNLQVWKGYLKYLKEEYDRTKNDDMLDEIVRTQKEIELMEIHK